ncbi:stage II sporulation protein D [Paenibacillus sp. P96]|uniref:Stage II sporulation protein D n=1 Tax=Paenibacillus zeirhizosphaerae TaxID=2987519 RepID=A0ABT9FMY3_9BACL|nr:stage II sporulation protein D [Paenibacillus sp. P96]MDP4096085.1 stage II sporulation protein D [Paenibacillus sp. P96]
MKDSRARIRIPLLPPEDEPAGRNGEPDEPLSAQQQDTRPIRPKNSRLWGKRLSPGPIAAITGLLVMALLLPAVLVWPRGQHPQPVPSGKVQPDTAALPQSTAPPSPKKSAVQPKVIKVSVFVSSTGTTETLPLEDYITGVVAAEMPPEFEHEALKAQAIAARTFIARRLLAEDTSGAPAGADVNDTVEHQVYLPLSAIRQQEKDSKRAAELSSIRKAVKETEDTIMTYKGKPITASFFSTSNGYTENSEDVWMASVPYLRSVPSPWDQRIAPGYQESVTMKTAEVLDKLGLKQEAVQAASGTGAFPEMKILSTTEGHRIKSIRVGDAVFEGTELRQRLGLRSSEFSWRIQGDRMVITTYGYGHGVGMSQWGANGMAKEGYTATQILKHYYTGISFSKASKLLAPDKI